MGKTRHHHNMLWEIYWIGLSASYMSTDGFIDVTCADSRGIFHIACPRHNED